MVHSLLYNGEVFVYRWIGKSAQAGKLFLVDFALFVLGIVLVENGGNIVNGCGGPADSLALGFGVLHAAFHPLANHVPL